MKGAGPHPVTFDLGSYDITTGYCITISSQFIGHTWGEAQATPSRSTREQTHVTHGYRHAIKSKRGRKAKGRGAKKENIADWGRLCGHAGELNQPERTCSTSLNPAWYVSGNCACTKQCLCAAHTAHLTD